MLHVNEILQAALDANFIQTKIVFIINILTLIECVCIKSLNVLKVKYQNKFID